MNVYEFPRKCFGDIAVVGCKGITGAVKIQTRG